MNNQTDMAKWFCVRLRTKWLWVKIPLLVLFEQSKAMRVNNANKLPFTKILSVNFQKFIEPITSI